MKKIFDFSSLGLKDPNELSQEVETRLSGIGLGAPEKIALVPGRPGVVRVHLKTNAPTLTAGIIETSELRNFLTTEQPQKS